MAYEIYGLSEDEIAIVEWGQGDKPLGYVRIT